MAFENENNEKNSRTNETKINKLHFKIVHHYPEKNDPKHMMDVEKQLFDIFKKYEHNDHETL